MQCLNQKTNKYYNIHSQYKSNLLMVSQKLKRKNHFSGIYCFYLLHDGLYEETITNHASGIYEWRPEWCKAQYTYDDAKFHLDLPIYNFEEAITYVGDITGTSTIPLVNSNMIQFLPYDKDICLYQVS